jgi:putative sterol carrier protein
MSPPWITAWGDALRASEPYRRAAATWEGSLVVWVEADLRRGFPESRGAFLDLARGDCHEARPAEPPDLQVARYVIRGGAAAWGQVLSRTVDPLWALMSRKLVLDRGSLAQLTPYAAAAKELVVAAMTIETSFPEGWRG